MANPNDIVQVAITVQDAVASVQSFDSIMILADAPFLAGTVQEYDASPEGLAAMVTAGFNLGDAAKLMGDVMAAQNPGVSSFKVFSRTLSESQAIDATPTVTTEGYVYSLGVRAPNGTVTTVTKTNGAAETATTISTALQVLIDAITGVDCTDNTGSITIEPTTAGTRVHLSNIDPGLTIEDTSTKSGGGIAADLALALAADPDFYGVLVDTNEKSELVAAAAWCLTNARQLKGLSIDTETTSGAVSDDVLSTIQATTNHYADIFVTRDQDGYVNAALLSASYAADPGASTEANRTVSGPTVDAWDTTSHKQILSKGGSTYETYLGLNLTREGKALSGRYNDITRGVDWLAAILKSAILSYLAARSNANSKVPFTDVGIGQIEGVIRGQLAIAEGVGFIAPGWTVTVPKAADVSTADKAARILRNLKFQAELAGAIHTTIVSGTITV